MTKRKILTEKIMVAGMFILVLVLFSLANRDYQKIRKLHPSTAQKSMEQPRVAAGAAETAVNH